MSPSQGRRPRLRKDASAGSGPPDREAVRRFGLAVFGGAFVLLFAIVAIAEGVGHPDPSGEEVAVVEDVPGEAGTITRQELDRTIRQTALQSGLREVPERGGEQYEEMRETALNTLLDIAWVEGQAEEMGIDVGEERLEEELEGIKQESFESEAEFDEFVKESGFSDAEVDELLRVQILSEDIQEQLLSEAPSPSGGEIEAYYEAAKGDQFTREPNRDVRTILNEDRETIERVRERLSEDSSDEAWERLAKRFSEEEATKREGGLQEDLVEGALEEPLDEAVFETPEGELEGPIETSEGFYVFEVEETTPEEVQSLEEVEQQIEQQLAQQLEQSSFNEFVEGFGAKWASRTYCAPEFVTERCANFAGDPHPETAPPGCYEASPEGGRPEDCPAPVFQLVPALPGTISPLEPGGTQLAQRPRPAGLEEGGAEAQPGLGGFAPPPGTP